MQEADQVLPVYTQMANSLKWVLMRLSMYMLPDVYLDPQPVVSNHSSTARIYTDELEACLETLWLYSDVNSYLPVRFQMGSSTGWWFLIMVLFYATINSGLVHYDFGAMYVIRLDIR